MKTIKFLTAICVIALILSGCKGDTGPQGPSGTNGVDGNANVTGQTYSVTSWGWTSPVYYIQVYPAALTASIQNSGSVEVFVSIDAGVTWNGLPATHVGNVENAFWSYETQTGLVQVNFEWNSQGADGDPNATYSATCQIKVVCIAPAAMKKYPNTNWKDYSQVKAIMDVQKTFNN